MVSLKRSSAICALVGQVAFLLISAGLADPVMAQSTAATGDGRGTVTEPAYHPVCVTVKATKYLVSTNALNLDPFAVGAGSTGGTFGVLGATGGSSFEPSSSSSSYVSSESLDNSAINAALAACAGTGEAVELALGNGGQRALVVAPFNIPSGTGLQIDAGVEVEGSRNLSDYLGSNCGVLASSSSCHHLITSDNSNGSFIEGPGVINGRGWDKYIGRSDGFYYNRIQAYCNKHGGAINGSPACTPNSAGNNSYGPNLLNIIGETNFTLHDTTFRDSGNFTVNLKNCNNVTIWGVKVIDPFNMSNTDGIDPLNCTNVTIANSYISNGDNFIAIKSDAGPSQHISILNLQTGAGICVALGTDINSGGIFDVLIDGLIQNGNLYNSQSCGIQIGSSTANGGLADRITYQHFCTMNESATMRFYTNYGCQTGSKVPRYTNLLVQHGTVLPSTAPYPTGKAGSFTFQGLFGHLMGLQLNDITVGGTIQPVAQQCSITKDQYANVYLGPGPVPSGIITQLNAGTGITISGTPGSGTPYPCTTSTWHPLIGDVWLSTSTSNLVKSYTVSTPTAYIIKVHLQPATDISTKESAALTQPVTILDNGVSVGTATLAGGNFAQFPITSPPPGMHVYTIRYPGDANYSAFTFGSVTVTTGSPPLPPTPVGSPLMLSIQ